LNRKSDHTRPLSGIVATIVGSSMCMACGIPLHSQAQSESRVGIPKLVAHDFGSGNPSALYLPSVETYIPGDPANYLARPYLADGFIGIRPNPNPLSQSETVAAGYVFTNAKDGYEMASPAPYPLGVDIRVDGTSILDSSSKLVIESQTLDMSDAELVTKMNFNVPSGPQLNIEVTQFLARTVPSILCQEIRITSSDDTSLEINPEIMWQGMPGTAYRKKPVGRSRASRVLGVASDRGSRVGIAIVVPQQQNLMPSQDDSYLLALKRGQSGVFREMAAVITSAYDPAPDLQAIRVASWGEMLGFDELRKRNRHAWSELWQSRVVISGDESAQQALDAAFFYLHSSTHAGLFTGVPPFGASQWLDYSGHAFWDMDAWIMPAVLPADPDAAEAMVRFRYNGLRAAEDKAASFGFEGAMYPWEAGVDGSEVTPAWAATGWDEQHVIPEVALSAWEYYEATGNINDLHEYVWPIIYQVAEWIAHRGVFTARGYEIENLMGANEGIENVRNESMVMLLCKMVMGDALKAAQAMGRTPPELWTRVYHSLHIPVDPEKQVLLPFSLDSPVMRYDRASDEFKPVNVMEDPHAYTLANAPMLVFHDPPIPQDLFKRTWDYEEKRRTVLTNPTASVPANDRAPGFTTPPIAVCAAMFGEREKAASLFTYAATRYVTSPFLLSSEYHGFLDGNYLMNQASLLMAAMYGFTGVRISDAAWNKRPASLPAGWTRIEIQRLWIHGKAYHLLAEEGKPAILRPAD
jgi:protein-glucosylgalactosylhydroxylysine glucosidase